MGFKTVNSHFQSICKTSNKTVEINKKNILKSKKEKGSLVWREAGLTENKT